MLCAGEEDDDDPSITIVFSDPAEIHGAMSLPEAPHYLRAAANPAASKAKLIKWFTKVVKESLDPKSRDRDVCDRDGDDEVVEGSYSGLRGGEWETVVSKLTLRHMRDWGGALDAANLSCGKLKVTHAGHGRGGNRSAFPNHPPFLS